MALITAMASMALDTTMATPITIRDLSVAAKFHIDRTMLKFTDDPLLMERLTPAEVAARDADPTKLHSFPKFSKLPGELQTRIWGFYALMYPRGVDPASTEEHFTGEYRNMGLDLREVNQLTRLETYTLHGYVKLSSPTVPSHTYLFNPIIDLLMLSPKALALNGFKTPATVTCSLSSAHVLHKVRSVVFERPRTPHKDWISSFSQYSGLEVLFVVMGQRYLQGTTELKHFRQKPIRWKLYAIDPNTTMPIETGSNGRGMIPKLKDYKQELMELLAANEGRKAPEVVFVQYVHIYRAISNLESIMY